MTTSHLCVGGPLDGQYRSVAGDVLSFSVAPALQPMILFGSAAEALRQHKLPSLPRIEYVLVWSSEHGRFVWWCDQ